MDKGKAIEASLKLAGNQSDEAREAVMLQRELKNKKKALLKCQQKMKKMALGDDGFEETQKELAELTEKVSEIEKKLGITEPVSVEKPKAVAQPAKATAPAATAPPVADAVNKDALESAENVEKMLQDAFLLEMESAQTKVKRMLPTGARFTPVHPQVVETTILMEEMVIVGCNARTKAMITAFKKLLKSILKPFTTFFSADVEAVKTIIETNYKFMSRKREATSGMQYVKETLCRRFAALSDEERTPKTMLDILTQIETELDISLISIVEERSSGYISPGDTILVFGRSSVVELLLLHAAKSISFKVIVLDSAPLFEGRELTQRLSAAGIPVTYGSLTACCTLLPKATRVFIGAASVLQNGDVFSRGGTAVVAACAKSFRRPVLCFSESYKFVPEVWLGNIGQNQLSIEVMASGTNSLATPIHFIGGTGRGGAASRGAGGNEYCNTTQRGGYLYDLTPAAYVDMIICEMGCLHTSAIVAAIKDRESRDGFL